MNRSTGTVLAVACFLAGNIAFGHDDEWRDAWAKYEKRQQIHTDIPRQTRREMDAYILETRLTACSAKMTGGPVLAPVQKLAANAQSYRDSVRFQLLLKAGVLADMKSVGLEPDRHNWDPEAYRRYIKTGLESWESEAKVWFKHCKQSRKDANG